MKKYIICNTVATALIFDTILVLVLALIFGIIPFPLTEAFQIVGIYMVIFYPIILFIVACAMIFYIVGITLLLKDMDDNNRRKRPSLPWPDIRRFFMTFTIVYLIIAYLIGLAVPF